MERGRHSDFVVEDDFEYKERHYTIEGRWTEANRNHRHGDNEPHLSDRDHITSARRADEVRERRTGGEERKKKGTRQKMNQGRQVYHSFAFGRSGKLRFRSGSKRGQTGEHRYYGNHHLAHPHDQSSSYPFESKYRQPNRRAADTDVFTGLEGS